MAHYGSGSYGNGGYDDHKENNQYGFNNNTNDAEKKEYGYSNNSTNNPNSPSNPFTSPDDLELQSYGSRQNSRPPTGSQQPGSGNQENDILDQCQRAQASIEQLQRRLTGLSTIHRALMVDTSSGGENSSRSRFEAANKELMVSVKALVLEIRTLKSKPAANSPRNQAQIERTDSAIKEFMMDYRKQDERMHNELEAQQVRQYRIAVPDASDEQARVLVRQNNPALFQQAILQSDRQGNARMALSAAEDRQQQMASILEQIKILSTLTAELDLAVMEQQPIFEKIEQKMEETREVTKEANEQVTSALDQAKGANKKKMWCIIVGLLILVAIGIIIGVVVAVNKGLLS